MNPQQGLKITKFDKDVPRIEDGDLIFLEKSLPTTHLLARFPAALDRVCQPVRARAVAELCFEICSLLARSEGRPVLLTLRSAVECNRYLIHIAETTPDFSTLKHSAWKEKVQEISR